MRALEPPALAEIATARARIAGAALRTPLIRLELDGPAEIWLKLENLQPIGSFKLRGALNAIRSLSESDRAAGVYTASAGNMAQGVAWGAREIGIACTVLVPETAPQTKLDAITRLGARTIALPFDVWWSVLVENGYPGMEGTFIHPVSNANVIAGNATIGAEIAEDLGDVDGVFVPYGGGGLSCGIASALKWLVPSACVHPCEIETAAPLHASWIAGHPVTVERRPSFVDGVGGKSVLDEMWPLATNLLAEPIVVSVSAVASAMRLLIERARVVAEGAGGTSLAGALAYTEARHPQPPGRLVCVVSGGNIDRGTLLKVLSGEL